MFLRHYTYNQNHNLDEGLHESFTDLTNTSVIDRKSGEAEIMSADTVIVIPSYEGLFDELEQAIILNLLTLDIRAKQQAAFESHTFNNPTPCTHHVHQTKNPEPPLSDSEVANDDRYSPHPLNDEYGPYGYR